MKKRSITMALALVGAMALPLGKDYARENPNSDSKELLPKATIRVEQPLSPFELMYFKYDSATIDSVLNRTIGEKEDFIDLTLDTVSTYTNVVSREFIEASIKQESAYDPNATSSVGAKGLLQMMKPAWKMFGEGKYENNVYKPIKNIRAGIKYNLWLENYIAKHNPLWDTLSMDDKRSQILAAYNGGIGRLKRNNWNMNNMPEESRNHANLINKYIKEFNVEKEIVSAYYYVPKNSLETKIDMYSK